MNCGIDMAQALLAYKNGQRGYEPMQFNQRLYTPSDTASKLPYFSAMTFLPCSSRNENQLAACDYDRTKIDDSICTITRTLEWDETVEEDGQTVTVHRTEDVTTPILYAPLPRHKWSGSGVIARFSAGVNGLSSNPTDNKTCTLNLMLCRVPESKFVETLPTTGEDGVIYLTPNGGSCTKYMYVVPEGSDTGEWVNLGQYDGETIIFTPDDADTYVQVHRAFASYLITGKKSYNATYTSPSPVSSAAPGSRKRISLHAEGYFNVPSDNEQYFIAPQLSFETGASLRCEQAYLNVELYHEKI